MSTATAAALALFAPLAGCAIIALAGDRIPRRTAGVLASLAVFASFLFSVVTFFAWSGDHGELHRLYDWMAAGGAGEEFFIGFDLYIDALSIFEMLVVSGVGFLIHVYSIGYMHGDDQERRFFAYMNLFIFAMLMLVMAGNLVFLLIGWGLVGLASYLLIGFWHHRQTAVAAAKKAFIMNAIGDVTIMLGLFMVFVRARAVDYQDVFAQYQQLVPENSTTSFLIAVLLLGGAIAKSAQLPLHTWLPDAMEGPTPVSALIHAATMVTAGVYMVARFWPVFEWSDAAASLVALTGATSLLFAGIVALAQTDIKRIIAYSTMSQIGYMFVAVGIGAYGAAMFHLMTHAFFKALLFLGAGVVIHALGDEQDIRLMGGLKKHLPKTYMLFLIASLALAGIIPLAGFFSKDEILASAFTVGGATGYTVWVMGLIGVFFTGLYSFRLLFRVFHGEEGPATRLFAANAGHVSIEQAHSSDDATVHDVGREPVRAAHAGGDTVSMGHGHAYAHAHGEAPAVMMWPLYVLGFCTVFAGFLVIPGLWNVVGDFLEGTYHGSHGFHEAEANVKTGWALALLSSLPIAAAGIACAYAIWGSGTWSVVRERAMSVRLARRAAESAFGVDWLYDRVAYRPAAWAGHVNRRYIEGSLVGPSMIWISQLVRQGGVGVGTLQSGLLRGYALLTAIGVGGVVVWMVVDRW